MKEILSFISHSPEQTERFGYMLAEQLKPGDVVVLTGELGAGKTTLVRGVVRRIHGDAPVKSPSFIIVNAYSGNPAIYHIDLYRVDETALDDIGFDELVNEGIVLIEWGKKVERHLPEGYLEIEMRYAGESKREVTVKGENDWAERLVLLRDWLR